MILFYILVYRSELILSHVDVAQAMVCASVQQSSGVLQVRWWGAERSD
jgi:hypothetical protein